MHEPVLYHEVLDYLQPNSDGYYIDGTVGAGGHARGILLASSPGGKLLGLDLDPEAIELASERLSEFGDRVILVQASYTSILEQMETLGWEAANGILLDFGLSSMQLENRERGFSFQDDAPLDMRFDPENPVTAADLVNSLSEEEIADLLFHYGEERQARRIARTIVKARPVKTTRQLAELVMGLAQSNRPGFHPATRTFQALRIAVNKELLSIESVLPLTLKALAASGRLAIISFHSLEDRLVKQFMRRESVDCICPPRQPVCTCGHTATLREITHKPVRPQPEEIRRNPRSRSARLRVAEKI